jgi:LysR family transcriptional activator of glutamate synthase operon
MELQHLRYFCEIVEQGSITRAAENLYLSQPSLSRMLKLIEDELGIALFERTGKGMQLTKDGAYFHQEVKNAINILDHAKEKITGAASNVVPELTVAILIASVPLSNALKLFRELFPEIKYHFFRPENPLSLNIKNYDVCIAATPINFDGLQYATLYQEELVLLLPSGHRLAGSAYVDLKDLREESFIFPSSGSITRLICDSLCNYAGFIPIIGATTNNMVSVKSYLKMGVGINHSLQRYRIQFTAGYLACSYPRAHAVQGYLHRAYKGQAFYRRFRSVFYLY